MSEVLGGSVPQAGWYPDPAEPSVLRYWDGMAWTHHLQPAAQPVVTSSRPEWLSNRNAIMFVLGLMIIATVFFVALGGGGNGSDAAGGAAGLTDADAMTHARAAQTAIETYSTDHDGQYAGATPEELRTLEATLPASGVTVQAQAEGYTVSVASESGGTFTITRDPAASVIYSCTPVGVGECPDSGDWSSL
jgi:hypothetical protein